MYWRIEPGKIKLKQYRSKQCLKPKRAVEIIESIMNHEYLLFFNFFFLK